MRQFVKSFASFSWALSVYAFSQSGNLLRGIPTRAPTQKAAESFVETTDAIKRQFDVIDDAIFKPVDSIQSALIDTTFNFFSLNTFNPKTIWETSQNLFKWGVGVATQFVPGGIVGRGGPPQGWGPVNIEDAELFYVSTPKDSSGAKASSDPTS